MDVHIVARFKRVEEMAKEFKMKIFLADRIRLEKENKGGIVAVFNTVDEIYSYLNGYSYGVATTKKTDKC
jgi:hypothetical protein